MMTERIVADKSNKIYAMAIELIKMVDGAVEGHTPLHEFEEDVLGWALRIGGEAVGLLFDKLGHGNVGPECSLPEGRTLKRSEELKTREYLSVFGPFEIERYVYAQREGQKAELIPLDARLALPESKFSYLLQNFDQHLAVESPFQQVAGTIQRILGLRQHVDSLERTNQKMAEHAEQFHAHQERPPADEEGAILVETADGKGVPIRRPADAARIEDHQQRCGPKPDRKKMATVASVYSVDRHRRTPEQVVEALFREPEEKRAGLPKRPRPCHKRVRASLNHTDSEDEPINGRAAMFGWLADQVKARKGEQGKPLVAVMDGELALWEMLDVFQQDDSRIEVLDLLHVTPRLWTAAHLFFNNQDQRCRFVRQRVLKVLQGEVEGVTRGLRRMATLRLRGRARATMETICQYFENNRERMQYDRYLAEGFPIASGVIEGACRHVVKDRMERTGMNWTIPGAKAMLDLRSVYLSDSWDDFMKSYSDSQTERLHPHRELLHALQWQTAA